MQTQPLIAITFPNHWSIKNLLHSGVVGQLQNHAKVQGWASQDRIPHLELLRVELGLDPIDWVAMPEARESAPLRWTRLLQKCLLYELHGLSTERILQRSQRGKRTRAQRFVSWLARGLCSTPLANHVLDWLGKKRWRLTSAELFTFPTIPTLLFATNPVDFREDGLVKAAKSAGIPIHTMIPSWDNLSSKGVLFTAFDRVFVWNSVMQREVRSLYPNYEESQVIPVGIARFQEYEAGPHLSSCEFLAELGLDPELKTILFANTATKSFPDQPTVAVHLAEAIASGELPNAQLLVRCHPHDRVTDYDGLRGRPGVRVWPDVERAADVFGVETVPPADDLRMLCDTMFAADVCVNSASTIVLDAAACDCPIVSIAYDGNRELDYANSVKSFYDYTHQRPFLASGATTLVESRAEMIRAIQAALDNPDAQKSERQDLLQIATQGQPATQLAEALLADLGILEKQRESA